MTYPPETSDSLTGRIAGLVAVGLFVLLLGFWVASREAAVPPPGPEPLVLLEPAEGDVVASPIVLRFRTAAPLDIGRTGWGAGPYHVHAEVDGREIMPAAADIEPLEDGAYAWTLHRVEPGERAVRLTWSDPAHRVLEQGASRVVRIVVTDP
jgi:hypothetical protein